MTGMTSNTWKCYSARVSLSLIIQFKAWEDTRSAPVILVFTQARASKNAHHLLTCRQAGRWQMPDITENLPTHPPQTPPHKLLLAQIGSMPVSLHYVTSMSMHIAATLFF